MPATTLTLRVSSYFHYYNLTVILHCLFCRLTQRGTNSPPRLPIHPLQSELCEGQRQLGHFPLQNSPVVPSQEVQPPDRATSGFSDLVPTVSPTSTFKTSFPSSHIEVHVTPSSHGLVHLAEITSPLLSD